jgi:type I restriction-modification system DNA methylase subunit
MEYSTLSKNLTGQLSKLDKKNNGIYFTPPSCVARNLSLLEPYLSDKVSVLEPSCGSGEYITSLQAFPHLKITGIEFNQTIYDSILSLENERVNIRHGDFLKYDSNIKYDLIIGNPPYYVMKKDQVSKEFHSYFSGRPNIFILFIIQSLRMLNEGGILSFVLPNSFLNCLYYEKTRRYIADHFQILHIVDGKAFKYLDTQQDTIILIVQKQVETPLDFSLVNRKFMLGTNSIFADEETKVILEELYKHSSNLHEMGFKVSVGNVVWNQCKDILTTDQSKTRLIYSSDISNNTLSIKQYSNEEKKNFIDKPGTKCPVLVVNRGYGVGKYKFNYCLIEEEEYLIENHLICIESATNLSRNDLIDAYKKIITSFNDTRTSEFIQLYFGNNAINTTELNYIFPIYEI